MFANLSQCFLCVLGVCVFTQRWKNNEPSQATRQGYAGTTIDSVPKAKNNKFRKDDKIRNLRIMIQHEL